MENSQNVYVAAPKAGGAIWSAPAGTALPTDAVAPLPEAFKCLGFISEDGISREVETDTEDIKAYGGTIVKTVQTSRKETFKFTPIETNQQTLAAQYGEDNVTVGDDGTIKVLHNAKQQPTRVYVVETLLDDNKVQRDVVPLGRITEVGEQKYADGEAIASELTLTCEPDSDGNTVVTYIAEVTE